MESRSNIPYKNVMTTKSNLSSKVFRDIVDKLGLDYAPYETKEKILDESLLETRNTVAVTNQPGASPCVSDALPWVSDASPCIPEATPRKLRAHSAGPMKHDVEFTSITKNCGYVATPMLSRRKTSYRPCGEGLESKALLSAVLGWGGGNGGGNPDSLITPANISNLTEQYSHSLDGIILDAPVSATVNVTVGPDQGTQTLVFIATANDSLYAFNTATGQLAPNQAWF